MGRYYNGDIEGKFWFAVQSSDDGEFFGAEAMEQNTIEYYVEDLEIVKEGVKTCLKELGGNKKKLDEFFKANNSYNDAMLVKAGFSLDKINGLLEWYARLHLGGKIQKCIEEQGDCTFEAEL